MWMLILSLFYLSIISQNGVLSDPQCDSEIYKDIRKGHYKFTLDLIKTVNYIDSSSDYNVLSPANIYAALSIVSYAAIGQTKQQLVDALGLNSTSNDWDNLHTELGNLFSNAENNIHTNLTIANGLFVDKSFQINDSFKKFVQNIYKCEVATVDYVNDGLQTRDTINKWVSRKTNGKIGKICEEPYDKDTEMVLANALYFNAEWQNKFVVTNTLKNNFTVDGKPIQIQFMGKSSVIQYLENPEKKYKAIGLDYQGNETSIYFVLPDEDTTLLNVTNSLESEDLIKLINSPTALVTYKIPRVNFEYTSDIETHLRSLGVEDMFTNKADFSGLAPLVRVSKVTHNVGIQFNEVCTMGMADTVSLIIPRSIRRDVKIQPIQFVVNRPYLFFIHHHATNLILFYGTVRKPKEIIIGNDSPEWE